MSVSIDVKILDHGDLLDRLEGAGVTNDKPSGLLLSILDACGRHLGDCYVIMNNEYGDGYSPWYNIIRLIDSAYGVDCSDVFYKTKQTKGISYVDLEEVAEKLGITIEEE